MVLYVALLQGNMQPGQQSTTLQVGSNDLLRIQDYQHLVGR